MNPADMNQNQNQMPGVPGSAPAMNNPAAMATPAAPVAPSAPVAPAAPVAPVAPVAPEAPTMSGEPTPVNPVFNPAVQPVMPNDQPVMPVVQPVAPVFQPTAPTASPITAEGIMVGATDPITMPNLPKAPDPVEEELKAPMTAAAPVPGSIGSAFSMPAAEPAPQAPNNVAFNDPATMPTGNPMTPAATGKKKMSQKTLIMLCIAAGLVVVVLVIVLIMIMNGMISF